MDRKIEKKPWVRRNIWLLMFGSGIVTVLVYLLAFSSQGNQLKVDIGKITVKEVKGDVFKDYIAVLGTVEPNKTIYLDATVGGRVEEILIDEGIAVDKGAVIMKLSNDNLVLEISNNEAQVERAINDLESMHLNLQNQSINTKTRLNNLHYEILKLKREYLRNQELFKNEHISKEELDVSGENYEKNMLEYDLLEKKSKQDSIFMEQRIVSSQRSIERMKKNLSLTRKRLEKLSVKAPVTGELATLNPEVGEVISYGTRIGTINMLESYKLKVEIDEHYIARVRKQLKGACDFSNSVFQAQISKIYPEVVDGRFTVDMRFMDDIPAEIRIGQTSRIKLELGESDQAVLIPRGGFFQKTGGQWIFVVDESGEYAEKRTIQIGRQNPQYFEVLSGLQPGEKVIVSGYENFGEVDRLVIR